MAVDDLQSRIATWRSTTYPRAAKKIGSDATPPPVISPLDVASHDFLRDVGLPGEYPFTSWQYPSRTPFEGGSSSLRRAGRYSGYGTSSDSRDYFRDMRARGLRLGRRGHQQLGAGCQSTPQDAGEQCS